jgi:hypothetical protein
VVNQQTRYSQITSGFGQWVVWKKYRPAGYPEQKGVSAAFSSAGRGNSRPARLKLKQRFQIDVRTELLLRVFPGEVPILWHSILVALHLGGGPIAGAASNQISGGSDVQL